MSFLITEGLGKDYGRLRAVDSLDLAIEAGEFFGFLGPNGAGKSTAIHMIAGILTPSRGRASLQGLDVRTEGKKARALIGLVPQELGLYEDLTATENLAYFGCLQGLRGAALREGVRFALDTAALSDRAREPVSRFSGGMKRRLNLVVALVHRPKLLICDEPTVGVDPQSRNHLFETLRSLHRDHGMTILYTSHYMEEVEALCRRIAIMDHGRLVAMDTSANLLRAHAPGAMTVELEAESPAAIEVLRRFGNVAVQGCRLEIAAEPRLQDVVAAVEGTGARILRIGRQPATLESVFLELTGRHLRDAS